MNLRTRAEVEVTLSPHLYLLMGASWASISHHHITANGVCGALDGIYPPNLLGTGSIRAVSKDDVRRAGEEKAVIFGIVCKAQKLRSASSCRRRWPKRRVDMITIAASVLGRFYLSNANGASRVSSHRQRLVQSNAMPTVDPVRPAAGPPSWNH